MATSTIKFLPSIVEQGTDGIWTYRKWSDGAAECWGMQNDGSVTFNNRYGNGSYAPKKTIAFPSSLFIEAPEVQVGMRDGGGYGTWFCVAATTNTNIEGYPFTVMASNITTSCIVDVYAIGKWK